MHSTAGQNGWLERATDDVRIWHKADKARVDLVAELLMISPGVWLGAPRPYRPLPRSLRRRSHCLISCLNIRFRLHYVGANACKNFKHLRLLIGRQVDEFAAVI